MKFLSGLKSSLFATTSDVLFSEKRLEHLVQGLKKGDGLNTEITVEIEQLSLAERWMLLQHVLNETKRVAFNYLHIPKTGGTSLGETLANDKHVDIVSVDALPVVFARQISRLYNTTQLPVMVRAHHSLQFSALLIAKGLFTTSFLTYRNPIDIHVSNINMIIRRLVAYEAGEVLTEPEIQFCREWLSKLTTGFADTEQFAVKLANSDAYLQAMGNIYARNLNTANWQKLVKQKSLLVLDTSDIDRVFNRVFKYEKVPLRKNVSHDKWLTVDCLTPEVKQRLQSKDVKVVDFLNRHLSDADEFCIRLEDVCNKARLQNV
ncbi:MAG TPA: hypothetical protein VIN66_06250 [Rheinheimera sp.]|uniref:hypothetical protein n=1 Tax=Rheinheimera sp. TaxID=1869214 RepID=UPI002F952781